MKIYTIGYTGFSIEEFILTLKKHKINSVIDVRSMPYSKIYSDYNEGNIKDTLRKCGVYYRNYKKEFGARQENELYYPHGYLDFSLFTKSETFKEGMNRIISAIPLGYNFVLMCSEKKPIDCHRCIMVAKAFYDNGLDVNNIISTGEFISQSEIEKQLVDIYYPNRDQLSLFDEQLSWDEMVKNSYGYQNEKIGYRKDNEENE